VINDAAVQPRPAIKMTGHHERANVIIARYSSSDERTFEYVCPFGDFGDLPGHPCGAVAGAAPLRQIYFPP
jgi:hypothetical protein